MAGAKASLGGGSAGLTVAVVSINWSKDVVREVLEAVGLPVAASDDDEVDDDGGVEGVVFDELHCNDLDYELLSAAEGGSSSGAVGGSSPSGSCLVSTGAIAVSVGSAAGKMQVQDALLKKQRLRLLQSAAAAAAAAGNVNDDDDDDDDDDNDDDLEGAAVAGGAPWSVFVGDSVTDLPVMVSGADVGILVETGSSSVARAAAAFGVDVRPIAAAPADILERWRSYEGRGVGVKGGREAPLRVYSASSWAEIGGALQASFQHDAE